MTVPLHSLQAGRKKMGICGMAGNSWGIVFPGLNGVVNLVERITSGVGISSDVEKLA